MSNCPLNDGLLERLFADEVLSEELKSLKKHLDEELACCEEFFMGLDEDTEEAFFGYIYATFNDPGKAQTPDDDAKKRMFANIEAKLEGAKPPALAETKVYKFPTWKAFPIAASIVILAGLAFFQLTNDKTPQVPIIKGGEVIIDANIYLQFSVLHQADAINEKPKPVSGDILGEYRQSDGLIFRYELDAPGHVYLFRAGLNGRAQIIFPLSGEEHKISETGAHFVKDGGNILLSKLSGLSGAQTFCAVVLKDHADDMEALARQSEKMFNYEKLRFAAGRLRADGMDCFQITVLEE